MMNYHLEPIIWTVRGGDLFVKFGDPYEFVCTVTKTGPESCRITGAVRRLQEPNAKEARASIRNLLALLKELGFNKVEWER